MSFFRKALGKVGSVAKKVAPFTAFIPGLNVGVGAAAALGGLGAAAERAGKKGANLGNVLGAGAKGAAVGGAGNYAGGKAKGALGALGRMRGGGGGGADDFYGGDYGMHPGALGEAGAAGSPDEAGWLQRILGGAQKAGGGLFGMGKDALGALGGGNPLLGLGALGAVGMDIYDQRQQRKSSEAFEQQKLDMMLAGMGKAEEDWDSRAGLREGGREAVMAALAQMQQGDSINHHLNTMGTRRPGEFMARPGAV
jgi:hypothetical protein